MEKTEKNYDVYHRINIEIQVLASIIGADNKSGVKELVLKHNLTILDFHSFTHQFIFKAVLECYENGIIPTVVTICQFRPGVNPIENMVSALTNSGVLNKNMKANTEDFSNYKKIIEDIYIEVKTIDDTGEIANYIPELANVSDHNFGIHITTIDNESFGIGDFDKKFSIQSVSKVFALTLAYKFEDAKLWERVGIEPSGNPFNSLLQLETDHGKPRNPFINSGAIVICDVLFSYF